MLEYLNKDIPSEFRPKGASNPVRYIELEKSNTKTKKKNKKSKVSPQDVKKSDVKEFGWWNIHKGYDENDIDQYVCEFYEIKDDLDENGEEIVDAYERKVTSFESIILINKGENKFEIEKLPPLAQSIPILTSDSYDINEDGYEDVIVGGNIYNTEVETPRLDNQFAVILISDKNKNYSTIGPDKSGLYLSGNTKSLKIIDRKNPKLLVANNNSNLEVFELNK